MKKRISVILSIVMLLSMLLPVNAIAAVESGNNWSYDTDKKVLTIRDDIPDFDNLDDAPWLIYKYEIRTLIIEDGVTGIGDNAFAGFNSIKNVEIPATVKTIGSGAFTSQKLLAVELPDSVETVAADAFSGTKLCVSESSPLASANGYYVHVTGEVYDAIQNGGQYGMAAGSSIATWDVYRLADDTDYALIVGGEGNQIGAYTQKRPWSDYAEKITTLVITPGVTRIAQYMFAKRDGYGNNLTKLEDVSIADTVTIIQPNAFENLPIKYVDLSNTVTEVLDQAFNGTSVRNLEIPGSIQKFGQKSFSIQSLQSLTLCEGLKSIETGTWKWDGKVNNWTPITDPNVGAFANAIRVTEVVLPEGLEVLGKGAFRNWAALTDVILPDSINSIDSQAFYQVKHETLKFYSSADNTAVKKYCETNSDVTIVETDWLVSNAHTYWCLYNDTQIHMGNANKNGAVKAENLLVVSGEAVKNETIKVSYDFNGGSNFSKIILAYKDSGEYKEVVSNTGSNEIELTLTDMYLGKELYAAVLPMNTLGECGDMSIIKIGTVQPDMSCTPTLSVADGKINASVTATFNKGSERHMLGVVCQFDENNELIGYAEATQKFEKGKENTLEYKEPIKLLKNTENVKLFIWDGMSIADNTMSSLWDYVMIDITE